ncbi:MAG TPA: hypothetical protein VG125_06310 [Pirellulales bacterium]|nr:hypothetical protein [Pirellulales bacterium]
MTLIVLMIVATPIVVANLSHDERPPTDLAWPPPNAAYGWPLIWHWCQFKPDSSSLIAGTTVAAGMNTELVEWSGTRLAGNLAMWLVMLAAVGFVCQWLLLRYGPRRRYRPRIVTLIVLALVAAPIVLANLSGHEVRWPWPKPEFGWPLLWRWRNVKHWYGAVTALDQNYSAARLTANLAMWLVMLAAACVACEWLLRRYQPRFRWNLRTMLAVVGVVAALCAWCVSLRERANLQDPLISVADSMPGQLNFFLYLEVGGPRWLDLLGAHRFRRRVVGADLDYSEDGDAERLGRLGHLPDLRYLKLGVRRHPTPEMAAALGNMSRLRILRIDGEIYADDVISQETMLGVGKLTQLEELHLGGKCRSGSLAYLATLTHLKSLSLQIDWDGEDENESDENEMNDETPLITDLPALPRLEALDVRDLVLDDRDIHRLAVLPRLKSLNLRSSHVTEAGLAELASLKSLQELAIGGGVMLRPTGLQSLLAIKGLKVLHIQRYQSVTKEILEVLRSQDSLKQGRDSEGAMFEAEWSVLHLLEWLKDSRSVRGSSRKESDRLTTVALDHGDRIFALESEVDDFRRALDALRQAHPGIVIDSDSKWFDQHRGEKSATPPWEL